MWWTVSIFSFLLFLATPVCFADDADGVEEPTLCEVCKILAVELQTRLDISSKSKEVIETGHGLDTKKKKKNYKVSELRLIEALHEPHICDQILKYNVHKERKGSLKYAKGMSETMQALHGLVNKGVKVELGMPQEMWDEPPAEVTQMQRKCYHIVEEHDEEIEDWYYNHQDERFVDYICRKIVLNPSNNGCLDETTENSKELESESKRNIGTKGDRGAKGGKQEL